MMDDPNELVEHLRSFFPHDESLAVRAVSELFPSVPTWVAEMIVFEFFHVLRVKAAYQEYLAKFVQYDDNLSGKSRDLNLPMDLFQSINPN